MDKPFYPDLTTEDLMNIQILLDQIGKFPDYLMRDECPWKKDVLGVVQKLMEGQYGYGRRDVDGDSDHGSGNHVGGGADVGAGISTFFAEGVDQHDAMVREIDRIYTDALKMERQLDVTDASEKIQLMKTRTQLLQKLVDLRGAVMNLKALSDFQSVVLETMQDVLTVDQRTDFMKRIEALA